MLSIAWAEELAAATRQNFLVIIAGLPRCHSFRFPSRRVSRLL